LDGVKQEVAHGGELQNRLIDDVLLPRHKILVNEIVKRTESSTQKLLSENRHTVRNYISGVITRAMKSNPELTVIGYVPVLGSVVNKQLDHAVGDIVSNVVEQLISDLSGDQFNGMIENYIITVLSDLSHTDESNHQSVEIIHEVIDLLKEQVSEQRWKQIE